MAFVFAEEGIICEILESEVLERQGRKQLMELEQRLRHQEAARKQVVICILLVIYIYLLCMVGLVVCASASHVVGRSFASWLGHTKDHHKNDTNCLPAWHTGIRVGV